MSRLDNLKQLVDKLYAANHQDADQWNDWGYKNHVLAVAAKAKEIAAKHGANEEFCEAGALLHDIADTEMARKEPDHEARSLAIAQELLQQSGYNQTDADYIVTEIIAPHSCNDLMPTTEDGKVLATADGAAHFLTDQFLLFCWRHYGPKDDYQTYKAWVRGKLEKDFNKKIFYDDTREEIRPHYEALKLVFS